MLLDNMSNRNKLLLYDKLDSLEFSNLNYSIIRSYLMNYSIIRFHLLFSMVCFCKNSLFTTFYE